MKNVSMCTTVLPVNTAKPEESILKVHIQEQFVNWAAPYSMWEVGKNAPIGRKSVQLNELRRCYQLQPQISEPLWRQIGRHKWYRHDHTKWAASLQGDTVSIFSDSLLAIITAVDRTACIYFSQRGLELVSVVVQKLTAVYSLENLLHTPRTTLCETLIVNCSADKYGTLHCVQQQSESTPTCCQQTCWREQIVQT